MIEKKAVRRLSGEKDSILNGIPTFSPDGFRCSYENCIREGKFTIAIKNNVIFVFVYITRIYFKMRQSVTPRQSNSNTCVNYALYGLDATF